MVTRVQKSGVLTQKPHCLLLGDVDVEVAMATQQGRQHQQQHVTPHRPGHRPVTEWDTWTSPSSADTRPGRQQDTRTSTDTWSDKWRSVRKVSWRPMGIYQDPKSDCGRGTWAVEGLRSVSAGIPARRRVASGRWGGSQVRSACTWRCSSVGAAFVRATRCTASASKAPGREGLRLGVECDARALSQGQHVRPDATALNTRLRNERDRLLRVVDSDKPRCTRRPRSAALGRAEPPRDPPAMACWLGEVVNQHPIQFVGLLAMLCLLFFSSRLFARSLALACPWGRWLLPHVEKDAGAGSWLCSFSVHQPTAIIASWVYISKRVLAIFVVL